MNKYERTERLYHLVELGKKYRRIMDYIHFGGSIFYDSGRKSAYEIIALLASENNLLIQKGPAAAEEVQSNG